MVDVWLYSIYFITWKVLDYNVMHKDRDCGGFQVELTIWFGFLCGKTSLQAIRTKPCWSCTSSFILAQQIRQRLWHELYKVLGHVYQCYCAMSLGIITQAYSVWQELYKVLLCHVSHCYCAISLGIVAQAYSMWHDSYKMLLCHVSAYRSSSIFNVIQIIQSVMPCVSVLLYHVSGHHSSSILNNDISTMRLCSVQRICKTNAISFSVSQTGRFNLHASINLLWNVLCFMIEPWRQKSANVIKLCCKFIKIKQQKRQSGQLIL